ncbi:MAG: tripartite tricarboxylate transporter substrate binding protein [Rhodoferax sp.]
MTTSLFGLMPMALHAADAYPVRPVKIISPYAAGGGPDVQLRQFSQPLGEALKQSVVIENKVGAGGVLAAQFVASAPADGYTLLMGSNTHLIQKSLQPNLKFEPVSDFVAVSNMASSPTVLVVSADSPYKSVDDLVSAARRSQEGMNYGSGGIGTSAHLAGATFATLNNLKVTHIPLKGSVEITSSLLRGDTQFAFPVAGTGVPQVKGGKLRALAVTSRKRLPQLPDVPTLNEVMKNELTVQESWFGIWAPVKTSADVVTALHAAVVTALRQPSLRLAFEAAGNEAVPSESPQAFAAFVRSEQQKWAEIVRLTGASAV